MQAFASLCNKEICEPRLIRVFSARDYEAAFGCFWKALRQGHGNDGAVLLITKGKPNSKGTDTEDLLVVRPQVLRSVKKQRAEAGSLESVNLLSNSDCEARRRANETGEQNGDELEFTRPLRKDVVRIDKIYILYIRVILYNIYFF